MDVCAFVAGEPGNEHVPLHDDGAHAALKLIALLEALLSRCPTLR
ncbi:hypothetical protein ABT369_00420 [Dactylosporangium sp. NPDC000244]